MTLTFPLTMVLNHTPHLIFIYILTLFMILTLKSDFYPHA